MHDAAAHISSDSEESPLTGNETYSSFKTQPVSDPPERVRTGLTGGHVESGDRKLQQPPQAGWNQQVLAPLYILSENLCSAAAAVEATAVVAAAAVVVAAAAAAAAAPRA